jgi:hypothetical protein
MQKQPWQGKTNVCPFLGSITRSYAVLGSITDAEQYSHQTPDRRTQRQSNPGAHDFQCS